MGRVILAFLLAPLPAALIESVVVALWPKPGGGIFEHPASMFVAMCLLFYLFELVLALPLYLALRRRGPGTAIRYAIAGSILTLMPTIVLLIWSATRNGLSLYAILYNLGFFGLGGFLGGLLFWRVMTPRISRRTAVRQVFE